MDFLAKRSPISQLCILIVGVLLALTCARYYYHHLILGQSFYLLRILLYIGVPLLLNHFVFKLSWKDMGLCFPQIDKNLGLILLGILILLPVFISLIFLSDDYMGSYTRYTTSATSEWARLKRFSIFIGTSIPGWEFMFRGFMLFALKIILEKKFKVEKSLAIVIPILWVMCFEVTYHFIKPDLEAFGMVLASPILSWLAIRSKSFWLPMFVHLYIEMVFGSYLIFVS
jgi:membrane protease YdiL (CAAX protease family)